MAEVVLPSGAKLVVSDARFEDADALTKALVKCMSGFPFTPDMLKMDVGLLKGPLIEAATSKEVSESLFRCFNTCTYESIRVTKVLFDDPKIGIAARRDYYPMAWEVIRVNCGPFFDQALSWFKTLHPTKVADPA